MRSVGDVEGMVFGDKFNDRVQATTICATSATLRTWCSATSSTTEVQDVAWSDSVVRVAFSAALERETDGVSWPDFLQELAFGGHFNNVLG